MCITFFFFPEGKVTKFDKVVKREICQITTKGTRVFSVIDGDASTSENNYLFALTEKVYLFLLEHLEKVVSWVLRSVLSGLKVTFSGVTYRINYLLLNIVCFLFSETYQETFNCIFLILFQMCSVGIKRLSQTWKVSICFR